MLALSQPGLVLSEAVRSTPGIVRAAARAAAQLGDGWCCIVWLCAASVS